LDNEAAAAIRSCSHLVGDDRKAVHRGPYLDQVVRVVVGTALLLRFRQGATSVCGTA
jgi:hypothetical protein